jgi:S-adenosyl methyltransferase
LARRALVRLSANSRHILRLAPVPGFISHQAPEAISIAERATGCRVVYADNDPLVLAFARALLASTGEVTTDVIGADLHDPADVIAGAARALDFTQPVAITLLAVLWHIVDDGEAEAVVLTGPAAHIQDTPRRRHLAQGKLHHPAGNLPVQPPEPPRLIGGGTVIERPHIPVIGHKTSLSRPGSLRACRPARLLFPATARLPRRRVL